MLKTVSSIANALGALNYKGTWNASTNVPTLASGVGTQGDYYVVSVAGSTDLDGVTNWGVGDWAAFNGSVWQRLEGGADGNFVNLTVSNTATVDGLATFNGNAQFPNNSKAIFGAGSDLQIYHNGSNSYIQDVGTGKLHIASDGTGVSIDKGVSEVMATFDTDGAVTLYHNALVKLATTATGIDVTGSVTAESLALSGTGGLTLNNNGEAFITIRSSDTGNAGIQFGDQSDSVQGAIYQNATDNSLRFNGYNNAEAIRIDSSGFVVIGATAQAAQNALTISQTGYVQARVTGTAGYFDRLGSDGTVIQLRKNGAAVGSVGTAASGNIFYQGGASRAGVEFGSTSFIPFNNGVRADATNDLGVNTSRFKDLYLSGGVYLGGTGAANLLNDFESGTFSGTVNGITYDGRYVKVGILVTVFCAYDTSSATGNIIAQLPFAAASEVSTFNHGQGITRSTSPTHPEGTFIAAYLATNDVYAYNYSGSTLATPAIGNGNFQFSYRTT